MNGMETLPANIAFQHNAAKAPALPGKNASYAQMEKVAEDFEAFFLAQALKPMFEGIEPEAPFGGGPSEDVWRSMQVQEYGKAIAKQGGVGIADHVLEQMIRLQEGN